MTTEIDLTGLADAGILSLPALCEGADWETIETICTYVVHDNDDPPRPYQMETVLQVANCYGIDVFRWAERTDSGLNAIGDPTLKEEKAREDGEEWATEHDEEPDDD